MFQLDNHLSLYEYTELIFSPCCSAVGLHLSAWLNWQVALLSRNADVDDTVHCVCAQAYACVLVCGCMVSDCVYAEQCQSVYLYDDPCWYLCRFFIYWHVKKKRLVISFFYSHPIFIPYLVQYSDNCDEKIHPSVVCSRNTQVYLYIFFMIWCTISTWLCIISTFSLSICWYFLLVWIKPNSCWKTV